MEIERKYKVTKIPDNLIVIDVSDIKQGYLGIGTDKSELRIRKMGSNCFLTYKAGTGLVRNEIEYPISDELFAVLWPKTEGKRITKKRTRTQWLGHIIEIDEFLDREDNLVTAEVEFSSEHLEKEFTPPNWFGEDVTNDLNYKNQKLAK